MPCALLSFLLAVLFPALHSDGLWDVLSDSDAIVCANRILNVSQSCHTLSTLCRLITVRVRYQGQEASYQDFLATLLVGASLAHDVKPQCSLSLVPIVPSTSALTASVLRGADWLWAMTGSPVPDAPAIQCASIAACSRTGPL